MSPVRIGIVGDFQSGKSTLVNCLLNRDVASIGDGTATTHAPITYCFHKKEHISYTTDSGSVYLASISELKHFDTSSKTREITAYVNASILKHFILIDMPGLGYNESDNKVAEKTIRSLDVAIVVTTNHKAIGGDNSQMYYDICQLRRFNIPYYLVLNCTDTSDNKWYPEHPCNRDIMQENLHYLNFYEPLSFPFENHDTLIVNFLWYWFQGHDKDPIIAQYESIIQSYGLRNRGVDKKLVLKKSNFGALQELFSMDNKMFLEIRKEFKQEINRVKDEICPAGTIQAFPFSMPPSGWLFCDGSELLISEHKELYAAIGVTYGGDGKKTFCIPDLRNQFIRGWKGEGSDRSIGDFQKDAIQDHGHTLYKSSNSTSSSGKHDHYLGYVEKTFDYGTISGASGKCRSLEGHSEPHVLSYGDDRGIHSHNLPEMRIMEAKSLNNENAIRVASETRPQNIALMFCIKADQKDE